MSIELVTHESIELGLAAPFVDAAAGKGQRPFLGVSKEDEMFIYLRNNLPEPSSALLSYLAGGHEAISLLSGILQDLNTEFSELTSFLDFACGHGKSTRFLVKAMDPARVWVSDIYKDAVDFQVRHFGVNGFYSAGCPAEVDISKKFQVIYAGSLFSHLPERLFRAWLMKLYDCLEPDGVLIFSTHGPSLNQNRRQLDGTGFDFVAQSESRSLDKALYGSTVVTEHWVRRTCVDLGIAGVTYLERSLWAQDVFIVSRSEHLSAKVRPRAQPLATVEQALLGSNGRLLVSGWAVSHRHGSPVNSIEVDIDGIEVGFAQLGINRADVASHFQRDDFGYAGFVLDLNIEAKPGLRDDPGLVRVKIYAGSSMTCLVRQVQEGDAK